MCVCAVSCVVALEMAPTWAVSERGVCCALCLQSCLLAVSLAHPPQHLPAALMAGLSRLPPAFSRGTAAQPTSFSLIRMHSTHL